MPERDATLRMKARERRGGVGVGVGRRLRKKNWRSLL